MLARIQGADLLIYRTVATSQPHNVARQHQLAITVEQRRVHLGGVVGYDDVVHRVALLGLRSALLFEHDEQRVDDFIARSQGVELLPRPATDEPQRRCLRVASSSGAGCALRGVHSLVGDIVLPLRRKGIFLEFLLIAAAALQTVRWQRNVREVLLPSLHFVGKKFVRIFIVQPSKFCSVTRFICTRGFQKSNGQILLGYSFCTRGGSDPPPRSDPPWYKTNDQAPKITKQNLLGWTMKLAPRNHHHWCWFP